MAILGPSFGLYSHIRRNRWRTGILLLGLFILVLMVTFAIGLVIEAEMYGAPIGVLVQRALSRTFMLAPFAALATGAWVLIGFAANTTIIASVSGAQSLERHDNPRLYGEPVHFARNDGAKAGDHRHAGTQCLRQRRQ
jgi:heat shock protein HtpX